jgi:molecular chaperone DnaJ
VPTLNGHEDLNIPSGTQAGAKFRIRGKGMPNVSGRGHGDLHVIARVAVPKKLTKEQKHLLEELGKTLKDETLSGNPVEGEKPFFERVKDIFG